MLALYRDGYRPSEAHPEPRTFLTLNAVVAPTRQEADERALPQLRSMARLRTGRPMGPLETVEEALATPLDGLGQQMIEDMRGRWLIGTPDDAAAEVRRLAARHGVEEVMVAPVAASYAAEPLDTTPGREQTLELLARALQA